MHPRLLELIESHQSTIVFVNARRLAERLATRLNELHIDGENRAAEAEGRPPAEGELVKAHHGSLSREQRLRIEDRAEAGHISGVWWRRVRSSWASTWARSISSSRWSRRAR